MTAATKTPLVEQVRAFIEELLARHEEVTIYTVKMHFHAPASLSRIDAALVEVHRLYGKHWWWDRCNPNLIGFDKARDGVRADLYWRSRIRRWPTSVPLSADSHVHSNRHQTRHPLEGVVGLPAPTIGRSTAQNAAKATPSTRQSSYLNEVEDLRSRPCWDVAWAVLVAAVFRRHPHRDRTGARQPRRHQSGAPPLPTVSAGNSDQAADRDPHATTVTHGGLPPCRRPYPSCPTSGICHSSSRVRPLFRRVRSEQSPSFFFHPSSPGGGSPLEPPRLPPHHAAACRQRTPTRSPSRRTGTARSWHRQRSDARHQHDPPRLSSGVRYAAQGRAPCTARQARRAEPGSPAVMKGAASCTASSSLAPPPTSCVPFPSSSTPTR